MADAYCNREMPLQGRLFLLTLCGMLVLYHDMSDMVEYRYNMYRPSDEWSYREVKTLEELSPKEEGFVRNMVAGMSQRQAYRKSHPASRAKDETIDSKASTMWKQEKVQKRYKELIAESQQKSIWTREMAIDELKWLKDVAKTSIQADGIRQANSKAFVDSVKELNVLGDVYPKEGEGANQESEVADTLKKLVDHFGAD